MNNYPRILFITINGWNNTTGTATIPSIIEGYPKECVASLFIRPDIPNSDVCNNYFNISELDVFKSFFNHKIKPGNRIYVNNDKQTEEVSKERKVFLNVKRKKVPFVNYIRDLFWKRGSWKTEELNLFIEAFNPDLIVFPAEAIISFLEVVQYVIETTKKPYIMFFWDDNFTYKSKGFSVYRCMLRKKIKKMAKDSSASFALTPKMQRECEKYLNIRPVQITRPINETVCREYVGKNLQTIKILYAGSLYIDRHKTLQLLVDEMRKINSETVKITLDIYTNSEITTKEKKRLVIEGISQIHAGVKKEEIYKLQEAADVLLFAEALKGKYRNIARLSFSTKITDYLSARRCILAIAPRDIAPIEYLKENDAAIIASNRKEIQNALETIVREKENILREYAEKSYNCGLKNHTKKKVFQTFCDNIMVKEKGDF